jgi:hypothetical protein
LSCKCDPVRGVLPPASLKIDALSLSAMQSGGLAFDFQNGKSY